MTFIQLCCSWKLPTGAFCTNHPQLRSTARSLGEQGFQAARWWEYCLEHLIESSILQDKARKAVHANCACGWPPLQGGFCARCIAREAEAAWQELKASVYPENLDVASEPPSEPPPPSEVVILLDDVVQLGATAAQGGQETNENWAQRVLALLMEKKGK